MVTPGQKFGDWSVLSVFREAWRDRAICRCSCGVEKTVRCIHLLNGESKSCGHGRSVTHGMSRTRTYIAWRAMRRRCEDPRHEDFSHYGGRGIAVCDRWKKFENFLADMGKAPDGRSIDRRDNDGNYEPGNCRWATLIEQANNTSRNRIVIFRAAEMTVAQAISLSGSKRPERSVRTRIDLGWDIERALFAKPWSKNGHQSTEC